MCSKWFSAKSRSVLLLTGECNEKDTNINIKPPASGPALHIWHRISFVNICSQLFSHLERRKKRVNAHIFRNKPANNVQPHQLCFVSASLTKITPEIYLSGSPLGSELDKGDEMDRRLVDWGVKSSKWDQILCRKGTTIFLLQSLIL